MPSRVWKRSPSSTPRESAVDRLGLVACRLERRVDAKGGARSSRGHQPVPQRRRPTRRGPRGSQSCRAPRRPAPVARRASTWAAMRSSASSRVSPRSVTRRSSATSRGHSTHTTRSIPSSSRCSGRNSGIATTTTSVASLAASHLTNQLDADRRVEDLVHPRGRRGVREGHGGEGGAIERAVVAEDLGTEGGHEPREPGRCRARRPRGRSRRRRRRSRRAPRGARSPSTCHTRSPR